MSEVFCLFMALPRFVTPRVSKKLRLKTRATLPTNVRSEISLCHNLQSVWIRITFHNFCGLCFYVRAHSRFDFATNFLKKPRGALDELGVCFV